jgi:hypothetical protein
MQVSIIFYTVSCDANVIDVLDENLSVTCKIRMFILYDFL